MSCRDKELVFLILQFLDEEKFKETIHKLEQESGFFFNMNYFEDEVLNGNWDEVEKYLLGFTKVEDNLYSMKMFDEIRKQMYNERWDKYLEGLKKSQLLTTTSNFRENEKPTNTRTIMLVELKKLIQANPLFNDKLLFPDLDNSRLRTLIDQSLKWQHHLCKNPSSNPYIKTLFVDHICGQPYASLAPLPPNNPLLLGSIRKAWGFPPLAGAHRPFQLTSSPVLTQMCGWMSNPSTDANTTSGGAIRLGGPTNPDVAAMLKHHNTPPTNNHSVDKTLDDFDHVSKQSKPLWISDEKMRKSDDTPKDKQKKDSHESEEEDKENENRVSDGSDYEPSVSMESDHLSEEEKGKERWNSTKLSAKKEALHKAVSVKTATLKKGTSIESPKKASCRSSFKQCKVVGRDTTLNVSSRMKKKVEPSKRKYSSLSELATKKKPSKEKAGKKVSGVKDKLKDLPSEDELRNTISDILKVDLDRLTVTKVLERLAEHYGVDFTPQKEAIKVLIREELDNIEEDDPEPATSDLDY